MELKVYKKIDKIKFGVLSPKQIKKMASAKIITPELYDKEGYPVDGGLMDIRMGVIDPGLRCKTCGGKLKECPGHFGYMELARPVLHIKFIGIILDLLRNTCGDCGRILIPDDKRKLYLSQLKKADEQGGLFLRRKRIKNIVSSLKTIKKCPHCKSKQKKIVLEKPTTFIEDEERLSPIEIRIRLEKIIDKDLKFFGINPDAFRPEWAVLKVFLIPPVTMRPSITLESGERSEDDLTHKLGDIVRINQRLFENINAGAPEIIIGDLWDLLQYHITTFFDNNVPQLPPARHRSGQELKTLTGRIKGKEGRIRRNVVGKRVNFSARTVISPDPNLMINEVGVPMEIAMKITVPERVNEWNIAFMKEHIQRGSKNYPGANYIIRSDGKRKKITEETKEQILEEIEPGFVVERHLKNGDIALFNRQPSLHRMSMMCHKVRLLPGKTLRLNPAVCPPYNADFDGDEMNLHIPQRQEAMAEAEILMEVQTQLISPRYGLSIIGCDQDAIAGNYLLTQEDFSLPRDEAVDLLMEIGIEDFSGLPDRNIIKGNEIFSCILPKDFSFKGYAKNYMPGKPENEQPQGAIVEIKKGKLIRGVLDKSNLGVGKGLLLRNIHNNYGSAKSIKLLGQIHRLGIKVLTKYGFSVKISDTDMNEETKKEVKRLIDNAYEEVDRLIDKFEKGEIKSLPGRNKSETLEISILKLLNDTRNKIGEKVIEMTDRNSGTMTMILSGARGNLLNIAQMAACVGQQALRGNRIKKGYEGRTLSIFKRKDLRAEARGFIKNSFKTGLEPHELFFMTMTGRDAQMDTALRTPKSGYLYRRLANALQDLKVEYDFTVRDSGKKIVQFNYGEDGMDVSKSEGGRLNVREIIDLFEE
jgi:DNA-directed RNA polymerase subunit A'